MKISMARAAALVLLLLAGSTPAGAQSSGGAGAERDGLRLQALVGLASTGDHGAGGALVGWEGGGWSVQGLGMVGGGGDYSSRLFAAAAGRRLFSIGPVDVSALLGAGGYGEDGPTDLHRSAPGVLFGGRAETMIGGLRTSLLVTDLTGRYSGDDVREPFGFHAVRFTFGVGL